MVPTCPSAGAAASSASFGTGDVDLDVFFADLGSLLGLDRRRAGLGSGSPDDDVAGSAGAQARNRTWLRTHLGL